MANDARTKEYFSQLKRRCGLILKKIQGEDIENELAILDDQLLAASDPGIYHGSDGLEVGHIKGFNATCVVLQQYVPKDPKTMTVVEFYQTLDIIKEQLKAKRKASKKASKRKR